MLSNTLRQDTFLRFKGNRELESGTDTGTLGFLYDTHRAVPHSNIYFAPKVLSRKNGPPIFELELYLSIASVSAFSPGLNFIIFNAHKQFEKRTGTKAPLDISTSTPRSGKKRALSPTEHFNSELKAIKRVNGEITLIKQTRVR